MAIFSTRGEWEASQGGGLTLADLTPEARRWQIPLEAFDEAVNMGATWAVCYDPDSGGLVDRADPGRLFAINQCAPANWDGRVQNRWAVAADGLTSMATVGDGSAMPGDRTILRLDLRKRNNLDMPLLNSGSALPINNYYSYGLNYSIFHVLVRNGDGPGSVRHAAPKTPAFQNVAYDGRWGQWPTTVAAHGLVNASMSTYAIAGGVMTGRHWRAQNHKSQLLEQVTMGDHGYGGQPVTVVGGGDPHWTIAYQDWAGWDQLPLENYDVEMRGYDHGGGTGLGVAFGGFIVFDSVLSAGDMATLVELFGWGMAP